MMHLIINGMLCLYAFVKDSIEDQLKKVAAAAHMLFALHREYNGKLFPNQLYHDLQSTFINFFFCAAKYKIHHLDEPLYSILLGTDILERLFGNYRLKMDVNSLDALELIYTTRAITKCEEILESHPTWVSNSGEVMDRLSLDYSKPSNWNSDTLILRDVDIKRMWENWSCGSRSNAPECFKIQHRFVWFC